MKRFFACTSLLLFSAALLAQTAPPPPPPGGHHGPPLSPAAKETATLAGKTITITYSSPRVRGREGHLFTKDGLISHDPHYPIWRAGANSATTLDTEAGLMIGKLYVPAGKYTLFVDISDPAQWVLIVSKKTGEWGLDYDPAQDLGRVKMNISKPPALVEELKYTIVGTGGNNGTLSLSWENVSASVPVMVH
jgi:hypothetical protein